MRPISFKRHRFPPEVIRQAVWLYFRFTLRLRDVEELLAKRGIDVSNENIRCWKSQGQAQRFVSTHSAIYNIFNIQRHLVSRKTMRLFRTVAGGSGLPRPPLPHERTLLRATAPSQS